MKKRTLRREMDTVGQTFFVENFSLFQQYYANGDEHSNCITKFTEIKGGGKKGFNAARRCCEAAQAIFHQEKVREALQITANSPYNHMSKKIKAQAQKLLDNLPPEIK